MAGRTGTAGTSGMAGMGMAGTSGGMAGMGGGMAGTSGGMAGMGGTPVDPRCAPLGGIVSWWHADGDYDDAVGANDGMSAGAAGFAPGINDQGFSLNTMPGSFVDVPNAASLQITSAITIDAWISMTAPGGRIVDKVTAFSSDGYMMDMAGDRLRLYVGGDFLTSVDPVPTGTLTHVAGVYNGTTLALYVNGVLSAENATWAASIPVNARSLRIGADSDGSSLFNGVIDEPRVFNRALSAAEIDQLFWQSTNCP